MNWWAKPEGGDVEPRTTTGTQRLGGPPGLPQEQLQRLSLQPGQPLHDRSHLPPGVLLIQQGQMRLLGVDQRKESFTLQRFGSGDLVGAELLLRGVPGLSLTAASDVEGSLLPAEAFFNCSTSNQSC